MPKHSFRHNQLRIILCYTHCQPFKPSCWNTPFSLPQPLCKKHDCSNLMGYFEILPHVPMRHALLRQEVLSVTLFTFVATAFDARCYRGGNKVKSPGFFSSSPNSFVFWVVISIIINKYKHKITLLSLTKQTILNEHLLCTREKG